MRLRYADRTVASQLADVAAGAERLARRRRACPNASAEQRAAADEEQRRADRPWCSPRRARGTRSSASRCTTSSAGIEERRVADQLERRFGDEARRRGRRSWPARCVGAGVEEPGRVGGRVADERDEPEQRGGEQRHARELTQPTGHADRPTTSQISITTGSTSGRRPAASGTSAAARPASAPCSSPGSVRSSTRRAPIARGRAVRPPRAAAPRAGSTTNPRVMISGALSSAPVCPLMATTGTTSPSPARCRRSRSTSSATSPRPRAVDQHPARSAPRRRSPRRRASNRSTSPFSISSTSTRGSRAADTRSAMRAWRASCRYSPCIGTKYRGLTRESTSFSSSSLPWPETWMCFSPSVDRRRRRAGRGGSSPGRSPSRCRECARREHDHVARRRPSRAGGRRWRCGTAPPAARPASRCARHSTSCAG